MNIYDADEIAKCIGQTVTIRGVPVRVVERAMCEYAPTCMSTSYLIEGAPDGKRYAPAQLIHALILGEEDGGPAESNEPSKKDRAAELVKELVKEDLPRKEIIERLADELELSKATASSYYYATR